MYKTTGLVGLVGTTSTGHTTQAVDALRSKIEKLSKGINDQQLSAAKHIALGGYQSAVAAKQGVVQDMGLQLLARGKFSARDYAAAVSGLTTADVNQYLQDAVKSPMTVVAAGSMYDIPKFDIAAQKLLS